MPERRETPDRPRGLPALKTCPWCRGALVFAPAYPITRLAPGESRLVIRDDIPATLRTVPAWTCSTLHCRYRESA